MAPRKRPTDINQLGKLIVDIAVGAVVDEEPPRPRKPRPDPSEMTYHQRAAYARADKLTPERRTEIARMGEAAARAKREAEKSA